MPLRDRRLVLEPPRPRRRVPAQLPRDRRRAPTQPPRDLPHTTTLRTQQRDLLPLGERQVAARHRWRKTRVHAASVAEPTGTRPAPNAPASLAASSVFTPRAIAAQNVTRSAPPPDRRPPRRRHLPPIQPHLPLPLPHRHTHTSTIEVLQRPFDYVLATRRSACSRDELRRRRRRGRTPGQSPSTKCRRHLTPSDLTDWTSQPVRATPLPNRCLTDHRGGPLVRVGSSGPTSALALSYQLRANAMPVQLDRRSSSTGPIEDPPTRHNRRTRARHSATLARTWLPD